MGDAQSAQRDEQGDAAGTEGETVKHYDDVQDDDEHTEDKLLPKNVPIAELNEKAEDPPEHANGLCEERVDADVCETNSAQVSPVPILETVDPSKEEESTQANVEIEEKEPPNATDVTKPAMSEAEAKMNEINESFRKFFKDLGVKLTVKKDSEKVETEPEVTTEKEEGEASSPEGTTEGTTSDLSPEQEPDDNNSTPSPTSTDITVKEVQETIEEMADTVETIKEVPSDDGAEDEDMSPIKRFFTTGIFAGLAKKKEKEENLKEETDDKELVDMGNQEDAITPDKAGQEEEEPKEELSPAQNEGELKIEVLPTTSDIGTAEVTDVPEKGDEKVNIPVSNEAELLSSQEREKNQGSPLRKLLSGAGLKKLKSKRQRGKKAAETKLTESGEHAAEQLESSTEGPSEGEETILSSSAPWEAFLCGSGKKRSRKTSDSDDETPMTKSEVQRSDDEQRKIAESPLESSQEGDLENMASSPEQAGSPSEGDGSSTWKSLKKLVTPKRKAKSDELGKDQLSSDSEITMEDSSFSIKRLIPGRKKRKTDGKQDQMSSDEADKCAGSDDDDSETPAVVPLSEFDMEPTDDPDLQIQTVIESPIPTEQGDTQQDLSSQVTDLVIPDILPPEIESTEENDNAVEQLSSTPVEDFEDLTEFISKHQQLSDIPEEGVIYDSIATPMSVADEISQDDTIAEDFIELTSEAYTSLEPLDSFANETEMFSALSQLTESSKTSGDTTPVPVEPDIKATEALLQEVVETICITSTALAITTEAANLERIAVSVSPKFFQTCTDRETNILEAPAELDALGICSDLPVGIDAFNGPTEPLEIIEAEDTPQPDTDMFYDSIEEIKEKGLQSADEDKAEIVDELKHEVVEIITCQVGDDLADIPLVETLDIPEPLLDTVMPEVQSPDAIEAALNPYYDTILANIAELDHMVMIKNVPSTQCIDNHEFQVQVVDANIESAEAVVEETLIKNVPLTQCMDDHEMQVQVVDADIDSATAVDEETLIKSLPSTQCMDDHEIQVQVVDANIESAEAVVETLIEVVSADHLAVEVVDVCVEEEKDIESAEAVVEALLDVVSIVEVVDVVDVCVEEEKDIESAEAAVEALLDVVSIVDVVDVCVEEEKDIESAEAAVEALIDVVSIVEEVVDVVDVCVEDKKDIESAEAAVETLIEVVSTGEVVDVCLEEENVIETVSATLEIEEDITDDEAGVHTQEINLYEMENQEVAVPPTATGAGDTTEKGIQYAGYAFDIADTVTENIKSSEKYLELPEESKALVVGRRAEDPEKKTTQTFTHMVEQPGGVVSSAVHLGAPSSLTLEVKLNFQFGQTREVEHTAHLVPERFEPVRRSAVSEIGVQATEEMEPIKPNKLKVVNTPDQIRPQMFITKPLKRTGIHRNQESGIQARRAAETTRQVEEEIDQEEVWLDAEDTLYTQEETGKSCSKVDECLEIEESHENQDALEESQQETHTPEKKAGIQSEDAEDFDIAHDSETSNATIE